MKIIIVPDDGREWVLVPKVATDETHGRKMNMREAFEAWYVENAFYYERDPIGSRDCSLQWAAFQAGAAFAARRCAEICSHIGEAGGKWPTMDGHDSAAVRAARAMTHGAGTEFSNAIREAFPEAFRA